MTPQRTTGSGQDGAHHEEGWGGPDTLLLLLAAPDRIGSGSAVTGITRLMKLLFLAGQEAGLVGDENFEFLPYKYGPFAPDLYDALRMLRDRGLIQIEHTDIPDYYSMRELSDLDDPGVLRAAQSLGAPSDRDVATRQWIFRPSPLGEELAERLRAQLDPDRARRSPPCPRAFPRSAGRSPSPRGAVRQAWPASREMAAPTHRLYLSLRHEPRLLCAPTCPPSPDTLHQSPTEGGSG